VIFPTANTKTGFYVAIALSIVISVLTTMYFNKKRWF
jgi:Mg2+ and Co2+ transporter CorA